MFSYTLKIWLTSVVTTPLVMLLMYYITGQGDFQIMKFYGWMFLYGGILSVPAALIFWGLSKLMITSISISFNALKLTCTVLAISVIVLSFVTLNLESNYNTAITSYLTTTIGGIWLYSPSLLPARI